MLAIAKTLILILISHKAKADQLENNSTCVGQNEEFQSCGTACPLNCENFNDQNQMCITVCVSGCFCLPGYVRNEASICIKPEDCPADQNENNSTCSGQNEEFQSCGTACPLTCANLNKQDQMCTMSCVSGCFCLPGYVRDKANICIKPEECSGNCAEHEEFTLCGTACPVTCANRNDPPKVCTDQCIMGCFCEDSYVRDTQTGKCVTHENCTEPCFENEIFKPCKSGVRCEFKCSGRFKCRYTDDCYNNCLCQDGFFRDTNTFMCVEKKQCTSKY